MKLKVSNLKVLFVLLLPLFIFSCKKETKQEKVVIEFYQHKPEAVSIYNVLIKKFEEKNPNIKVNQFRKEDTEKSLMTLISSGEIPDVFSVFPLSSEFKNLCDNSYILDLSNEKIIQNLRKEYQIKYKKRNYSVPISLNAMGIFYNKKIFKRLNLEIPKTYSELIKVSKILKENGEIPFVLTNKDSWTVGNLGMLMAVIEMGEEKSDKFFSDLHYGKLSSKDSKTMEVLAKRFLEIKSFSTNEFFDITYAKGIEVFAKEKAVMFIQGIWAIPSIKKVNPGLEFAMFPMLGTKAENAKVMVGIDAAIAIHSKGKNIEASKKFLEFLTSKEIAQLYSNFTKLPSSIKNIELKAPEIELILALIKDNKILNHPRYKWKAGVNNEWRRICQKFMATHDIKTFFTDIDNIFLEKK